MRITITWLAGLSLAAGMALAGCPEEDNGDGGGGDDSLQLTNMAECGQLPVRVPPSIGADVCVYYSEPYCSVGNSSAIGCLGGASVRVDWVAGGADYRIVTRGWIPITTSHGQIDSPTDADGAIVGVPPSTVVTATFDDLDGIQPTIEVQLRVEDDYVVFLSVTPQ
ncbi:MAG: hypothetical protein KC464_15985 [Myxococcales bacterium]|nr:hypothetical protein [Myxococcales bacterium]